MSGKRPPGHGGRRARARAHEEEHENHERWLVSYADMMTLLLVLFVVLYAMSQVDQAKFNALAAGFQEGFGAPVTILDDGASVEAESESPLAPVQIREEAAIDGTEPTDAEATAEGAAAAREAAQVSAEARAAYDQLSRARDALTAALTAAGEADAARFVIDERGLVIRVVSDPVLFAPESATLRPRGVTVLDAMAPTLATLPNLLRVEGHANSVPVTRGGPWPSNWELSAVRATTVLRHLAERRGVAEDRLSAAGYGSTRPLVPESDPSHVTANRRVDIIVQSTASAGANQLLPGLEAAAGPAGAPARAAAASTSATPSTAAEPAAILEESHP